MRVLVPDSLVWRPNPGQTLLINRPCSSDITSACVGAVVSCPFNHFAACKMILSSWKCPYCQQMATIMDANVTEIDGEFDNGGKDGYMKFTTVCVTCPNDECKEYSIRSQLQKSKASSGSPFHIWEDPMMTWNLRPQSTARPFPAYIPAVILADYTEACLIRDLSPKASATLARRCLQGMVRDFWGVKGKTLFEEISAIAGKVDADIYGAIDAVRKIGNIGAHMEKDINLVIDVEPEEAQMLIQLIEVLLDEWYVARKNRSDHLAGIVALAAAKKP
jgi:hypothetical protein